MAQLACLPVTHPIVMLSHVRATLGSTSKFSLYPAPVTNCRCAATIPCDGTICGGRRFGEAVTGASRVCRLALHCSWRLSILLFWPHS